MDTLYKDIIFNSTIPYRPPEFLSLFVFLVVDFYDPILFFKVFRTLDKDCTFFFLGF